MFIDWYDVTFDALKDLWWGFIDFIPSLIGALVIFIIGWLVSVGIGKLVTAFLKAIKLNQLFEKGSLKSALEKAEIKVDASGFIGAIFKWIFVIVFLLAAVDILGLDQFAGFLTSILNFLPNVVVAVLMFVVAVIVADIAEKVIRASVESIRVGYGRTTGAIVKWSIWIFAILAILRQLNVVPTLIDILLTGVVYLIVIAGGLAFGLGGKDIAADFLKKAREKLQK